MGWSVNYPTGQRRSYKPAGPIAGFFLLLIGLALLGGAWYTGLQTRELVTQGIHAEGIVTDVSSDTSITTQTHNGYNETRVSKHYHYTVDFKDAKGADLIFKDKQSSSSQDWNKGDRVAVIYLERDPKGTASIDHGLMNWLMPGILGLMGVFFSLFGVMAMFSRKPAMPGQ